MPRPKANPEQHLRAYQLFRDELGQTAIAVQLEEAFENPVSERTVGSWIRGFKSLNPTTLDLDATFAWHKLEDYGLPWEASSYLLAISRLSSEEAIEGHYYRPTNRQARWWWRIHQAVPQIDVLSDVWFLAQRFVNRELIAEVLGRPLEFADLEAHLAYRPWEGWPDNSDRFKAYFLAIRRGLIPTIENASVDELMQASASPESIMVGSVEANIGADVYFLPSQWRSGERKEYEITDEQQAIFDNLDDGEFVDEWARSHQALIKVEKLVERLQQEIDRRGLTERVQEMREKGTEDNGL
jgi:hypothetical protein